MFATEQEVAILKKRALAWQAGGYKEADPSIPQVMNLILMLDGIAPIWSCEGHYKENDSVRKNHQNFYIMFAITEKAFPTIQDIYLRLRQRLMVHQARCDEAIAIYERMKKENHPNSLIFPPMYPRNSSLVELKITFTNRIMPDYDVTDAPYPWFNVTILNGQTYRRSSKVLFFREFVNVLHEIIREKNVIAA